MQGIGTPRLALNTVIKPGRCFFHCRLIKNIAYTQTAAPARQAIVDAEALLT